MSDFRQLDVWNKAHQITLSIYRITKVFPLKNDSALLARCVAAPFQSARILLREEAVTEMPNSADSFRSPLDLRMSCNISYWWPKTLVI